MKRFTKNFTEAIRSLEVGDLLLWGTNSDTDPLEVFEITFADERYKYAFGRLTKDYTVFDTVEQVNATTNQIFEFREGDEVLRALNDGSAEMSRKYRDTFEKWKYWNFDVGVSREKVGEQKSFALNDWKELSGDGSFANFHPQEYPNYMK